MNRRNFIKTAVIASVITPTIVNGTAPPSKPERVMDGMEFINILTIEELRQHGIRSAIYAASCVDKYGTFAHEIGSLPWESWKIKTEPFIRQTFRIPCLPKIYSDDPSYVHPIIGKIRSGVKLGAGGQEYSVENIIREIKAKMEYVCLVAYAKVPCVCGHQTCKPYFIPVVGGLSKYRYQLYLKQMNG